MKINWKFDNNLTGPDGENDKPLGGTLLRDWKADFTARDENGKWQGAVLCQFATPYGADKDQAIKIVKQIENGLNKPLRIK